MGTKKAQTFHISARSATTLINYGKVYAKWRSSIVD